MPDIAGPTNSAQPTTALPYEQLYNLHQQLSQNPEFKAKYGDMGDFYRQVAAENPNSHAFDQGINANPVRNLAMQIHGGLKGTGIPDLAGDVGEAIGGSVGYGDAGRRALESLPEQLAAGAAGGLVGGPLGALAGFGADAALSTYGETGKVAPSLVSGAANMLLPGAGHVGESVAANLIGRKIGSTALEDGIRVSNPDFLSRLMEQGTEKTGQVIGLAAGNELTRQAVNVASGQGLSLPTPEDAVGNLLGIVAPMALDVIPGVHGKTDPGAARSMSEALNVQDAARRTVTDNMSAAAQDAVKRAQATMGQTMSSDEIAANVLNPAIDADSAGNPINVSSRPDFTLKGQPYDPSTTIFGRKLLGTGAVPAQGSERLPLTEGEPQPLATTEQPTTKELGSGAIPAQTSGEPAKVFTPTEVLPPEEQSPTPTYPKLENAPIDINATKVEPKQIGQPEQQQQQGGEPTKPLAIENKPVAEPLDPRNMAQLPEPIKQLALDTPKAVTPEAVQQIAAKVPAKVVSLSDFQELSELHQNLLRQVNDNAHINVDVQPITDKWINDRVAQHIDNGHTVDKAVALAGEQARQKTINDLNKVNNAIYESNERTQAAAVGNGPERSNIEFAVGEMERNPELARTITEGLQKAGNKTPIDVSGALANWIRRSRASADPTTGHALKTLAKAQADAGGRFSHEQVADFFKGKLDQERLNDILDQHEELFSRSGLPSNRGVYQKIVGGKWNPDLASYLRAVHDSELKDMRTGDLSLDAPVGEGAETQMNFSDTAAANHAELVADAADRHSDPVAVDTAVQLGEQRIRQVNAVQESIRTMSHDEVRSTLKSANQQAPKNIEMFRQQVLTYLEGIALHPQGRSGAGEAGKGVGRERGGLYPWLLKHQEFKTSATNMKTVTARIDAFLAQAGMPTGRQPKAAGLPPRVQGAGEAARVVKAMGQAEGNEDTSRSYPKVENAIAFSTHDWFTNYYKNLGIDPSTGLYKAYVDSAVRIAQLFPQIDKTRVGSLVGKMGGLETNAVGLAFNRWSNTDQTEHSFVNILAHKFSKNSGNDAFMRNLIIAHEFHHSLWNEMSSDPELYSLKDEANEVAKSLTQDDRRNLLQGMADMIVPKELRSDKDLVHELGTHIEYAATADAKGDPKEEFLSTFSGLLSLGMANPAKHTQGLSDVRTFLSVIPDKMREFTQGYYANLSDFSNGIKGYFNETQAGLGDKYVTMADIYKKMARSKPEVDVANKAFNDLMANNPSEFLNKVSLSKGEDAFTRATYDGQQAVSFVSELRNQMGVNLGRADAVRAARLVSQAKEFFKPDMRIPETYGKEPGLFWWATPLAQFSEKFPVLRPLSDVLLGYEGMVRNGTAIAMAPFGSKLVGDKLVRDDKFEVISRVSADKTLRDAYTKVTQWQNKEGNAQIGAKLEDVSRLTGLGGQKAHDILTMVNATAQAMSKVADSNIATSKSYSSNLLAVLASKQHENFTAKQSKDIGSTMFERALANPDLMHDPMVAMLTQKYGADAILPLVEPAMGMAALHNKLVQTMTDRPFYTPETQPNKFVVTYNDSTITGQKAVKSFETESQAIDFRASLDKRATVTDVTMHNPFSKHSVDTRYSEAAVNHFLDLERQGLEYATKAFTGDPDALNEFRQNFSPGSSIVQEMASMGQRKHMQQRQFVAGREDIDMLQNTMNYVQAQIRANGRNHVRGESMVLQTDPTLRNEPRLKTIFVNHQENVLNPPEQINKTMRDAASLYYVGGNFSSAILTALQPLQATLPYLTRQGTGIMGGLKYLKDATKFIVTHYGMNKPMTDEFLARGIKQAASERIVDQSIMGELGNKDDAFIANLKNMANDTEGRTSGQELTRNVAYQTLRVAQMAMQKATEHNHRTAFLASMMAARDQGAKAGLTGEALYQHAFGEGKRTVEVTMHSGGAAARPVGFGALKGGYGLAGNLYVLNHFTTSMMSIFSRLGNEAIGRTGLQGAELHNARKAFGTAMAVQMALGGALGLPFAGATVALLEKIFPNIEINKNLREFFASWGGKDTQAGGMIADAALQGLGTALSPADMSGRMAMGSVVGTNPYFGFEASQLLGATGSMFESMVRGGAGVIAGDPQEAKYILPVALQKLVTASNPKVMNTTGTQLVHQQTPAEQVMTAIGFRPKALAHDQEQNWINERTEKIQGRELNKFYQEQQDKLATGDFAGVRASLYDRASTDPSFSPLVGLRRIVEGYQKSQYVEDPANQGKLGDASDRAQLQRAFGQTTQPGPSATEKLLERSAAERAVGIPGAGNVTNASMSEAQTTDYLMRSYGLTESQARLGARQMVHGRPYDPNEGL